MGVRGLLVRSPLMSLTRKLRSCGGSRCRVTGGHAAAVTFWLRRLLCRCRGSRSKARVAAGEQTALITTGLKPERHESDLALVAAAMSGVAVRLDAIELYLTP